MRKRTALLSLLIAITLFSGVANAQKRIVGFFGSWRVGFANQVQWDKLTDVVYAFVLPNPDGTVKFDHWGTTEPSFVSGLQTVVNKAKSNNVKVHISFGGWSATHMGNTLISPDPIGEMVKTTETRKKFVDKMISYVKDYDLDGINADWEYPDGADTYYFNELIRDLKIALLNLTNETGKKYYLTAAVGALSWGTESYNTTTFTYLDYVYNMAFDGSDVNHSSVEYGKSSLNYWIDTKKAPANKMVLGLPFYSGTGGSLSYASLSNADPAAYYNSTDGLLNGYNYNSKPMIDEKIDYLNSRGGAGVFIWEITQDRNDQYSLLSFIANKFYPNGDVSTKKVTKLSKVSVTPTLFDQSFNIQINDASIKQLNYSLFDLTGKQIVNGTINSSQSISIAQNLSKGFYLLKLNVGEEQKTIKLVRK